MFFKELYINYFNIQYNRNNIFEAENRNTYALTLYDITQIKCTDKIYEKFLTDYILSLNCTIEFNAIFNEDHKYEDIDLNDAETLNDINEVGLKNLTLKIQKPINKLVIFDSNSFYTNLKDIMIKDILNYFSKYNNLFVFDLDEEIKNEYYSINKISNKEISIDKSIEISKKISKRNELSFFYNASEYNFIPDMFYFEEIHNKQLNDIFKHLLFVASIIFISDYSFFKENEFTFKIEDKKFSMRSYEEFIDMFNLHPDIADNYYLIYDCIYNDTIYDNISDKFEIALHTIDKCNTSGEIYIENRIFEV
ncbi:MAG TPA: hypothetical protein DER56_06845, partial [Thermosipho africanus]|nr:hypothetical protein [Thermosipho africanus]